MTVPLDTVDRALVDLAAGKAVLVIDDEDRENEGDLIFAAQLATPELVAFMVRYTSGYICVPITEANADRLDLPPMFRVNQDRRGTAYTVTVDAREGISTGISASDRATRSGCSPTPRPRRPTCRARATSFRCARATGACCVGPAIPKPRWTWPGWRVSRRRECSAKSSARRTPQAWPAPMSCGRSPTSMVWR
jgi:3,4-dihydroxy 2-butanone 4-phosphate synthase/GTP cyclohydrolase II